MDLDIVNRVKALIEPVVDGFGYELVEVEFVPAPGGHILRLFVDKPGGIGIDEITRVSREANTLLDVEDFIAGSYSLEVSSPGLDRPLVKPEHFEKALGKEVRILTQSPIEGRKNFVGKIDGFSDGKVFLKDAQNQCYEIELSGIIKARLEVVV